MGKQRYWSGHGRATRKLKNEEQQPHGSSSSTDHEEASSTSAGCMCAVFQLFDFHPLNQTHHQQPQSSVSLSLKPISLPPDHHISTGTEAPRNSLESDEELPLSCIKQNDDFHIPKGVVQIKTRSTSKSKECSNNDGDNFSGNSPGSKTPTLVARLMGLDLLPQSNSPSTTPRTTSSSVSPIYPLLQKPKSKTGSRSLPETPRTSCERKSNVENYHHRLSLQILNYDKENSTSTTHYAKEIVKQIKETVSRKSGLTDITNYQRRDHEVMMIQSTKPKKVFSSSSSLSTKLRVLEAKNNLNKVLPSPKVEAIKASKKVKTKTPVKKGNKLEEPFVVPSRITKAAIDGPRKKSKKTPLSNELLSFSSVPTVVKKNDAPFSSAKPPPMQSGCNRNQAAETVTGDKESKRVLQLSTSYNNKQQPHKTLHHHRHQHVIQLPNNNNNNNKHHIISSSAPADCGGNHHDITAEVDCVRKILTTRTTTNFLENNTTHKEVSICHYCNAKLLCHLAEELLKPYVEVKPWGAGGGCRRWPEVVEELCEKVRRYPRARCEVLEDIDGIIEKDLDRLGMGFEDQWEGIVRRIEEEIVEELLKETVRFGFVEVDGVV